MRIPLDLHLDFDFEAGDKVFVERTTPLAPGSLISIEPGDLGVVEQVGDHFLALRIHGMRVVVSKADVVPAYGVTDSG